MKTVTELFEAYSEALNKLNLGDRKNIILIHQALYRMFALTNKEWYVLHGSAVSINGKAILFGDDGSSIGKTTSSLFLYSKGKDTKYVADEFVLYKGGYVYPNRFYPIHCKESSKSYVEQAMGSYEEYLLVDRYEDKPIPLKAIVCPKPSGIDKLTRLTDDKAKTALKCTAYAHLIKLLNPDCDRVNIFTGKDNGEEMKCITDLVKGYKDFDNIPVYEFQIHEPKNIVLNLEKAGLFMDKPIKNHVSCGGLLFNADMTKGYLIFKKERGEWMLPKGHVEEGEDLVATAIREIGEETGYTNIEILDTEPASIIEYDFELAKEPEFSHHKIVRFYGAKVKDGDGVHTKEMDAEGLGGNWFDVSEIVNKLSHENEKDVARTAIKNYIK